MKNILLFIAGILFACCTDAQVVDIVSGATSKTSDTVLYNLDPRMQRKYNNNNFDNQPLVPLSVNLPWIDGEIANPGIAVLEGHNTRTVIIKEVIPSEDGSEPVFKGVFKYSGYPLADLLNDFVVEKVNRQEFSPFVDLFIVVENDLGESAIFSWGELFYSKRGNDILFATAVAPVFPTTADERWEVPSDCSIIAGSDFLSVRNIKRPTRITVRSFPKEFPGEKGASPLYAPEISITMGSDKFSIDAIPKGSDCLRFPTAFFGLHMGFKHISTFEGFPLSDILKEKHKFTAEDLQNGIFTAGARDGYRVAYSLSEIMNRSDLEAVLLIDRGKSDDGRFVVFPSADIFADRQLKGCMTGYITNFR